MDRPRRLPSPAARQRGIAVLHVTLVMVLLASLAVFMATRGAIGEQRQAANEVRTQLAYQAALAGLDHALAYFASGSELALFPAEGATAPASAPLSRSSYRVQFCGASATIPACGADATAPLTCGAVPVAELRSPLAVACGWSDDGSAQVQMVQRLVGAPVLPGTPAIPMVTYGSNNMITGGGSILNYFHDLTVWSGGPVPSQSATGKTFVRDTVSDPAVSETAAFRDVPTSPSCNNPPRHYVCSSNGPVLGPDVVANDAALASMTTTQFFVSFMGTTPTDYRASRATFTVDPSLPAGASNATSLAEVPTDKRYNQVLWVQGNVNTQIPDLGKPTAPVVLVIDGDWDVASAPVIHGLVYVTGRVSGTGNPTVNGALIANQVTINGNVRIVYDPQALALASRLGQAGILPGSFRDWRRP